MDHPNGEIYPIPRDPLRFDLNLPDRPATGSAFLSEVKHFHQGGTPTRALPISRRYLASLRAYGDLVGCPVKLAVYWERWNV
jgi:hypothetical protein